MKRLLRIEQAKNRQGERNDLKRTSARNLAEVKRTDARVADQFGISDNTMRKEISIVDNKDLLSPECIPDRVYGFFRGFYIFHVEIFPKKKKAQTWAYLASSCQNRYYTI